MRFSDQCETTLVRLGFFHQGECVYYADIDALKMMVDSSIFVGNTSAAQKVAEKAFRSIDEHMLIKRFHKIPNVLGYEMQHDASVTVASMNGLVFGVNIPMALIQP